MDLEIALFLASIVAWILVSARLSHWSVTAPIVLALAGLLLASSPDSPVHMYVDNGQIRVVVEIALALILFGDASKIRTRWFERSSAHHAARLLAIGLPLTIAVGTLVALPLFPGTSWVVLAVVAASLAPTDAALSASAMADRRIPRRLRDVINVESGLNDGLTTPFVLFFLAIATAEDAHASISAAVMSAIGALLVAVVVGLAVGGVGGRLLVLADRRGWPAVPVEPILPFCLALMAYCGSLAAGGNGFIAAFVAGIAFGTVTTDRLPRDTLGFTERAGTVLTYFVWFVSGAVFLRPVFDNLSWRIAIYACLSLTLVRMLPVAIALFRSGLRPDDVLFLGWLGPRGLTSIIFALIAIDELGPTSDSSLVGHVVAATVALSVVAHGVSGGPVAGWFARRGLLAPTEKEAR